jgi:hypothetical protein
MSISFTVHLCLQLCLCVPANSTYEWYRASRREKRPLLPHQSSLPARAGTCIACCWIRLMNWTSSIIWGVTSYCGWSLEAWGCSIITLQSQVSNQENHARAPQRACALHQLGTVELLHCMKKSARCTSVVQNWFRCLVKNKPLQPDLLHTTFHAHWRFRAHDIARALNRTSCF